MAEIKLNILAKDILESNYFSSDDCAITRALARAGYPNYVDGGIDITHRDDITDILIDNTNETYNSLIEKVQSMYASAPNSNINNIDNIGIEDFEHILIF